MTKSNVHVRTIQQSPVFQRGVDPALCDAARRVDRRGGSTARIAGVLGLAIAVRSRSLRQPAATRGLCVGGVGRCAIVLNVGTRVAASGNRSRVQCARHPDSQRYSLGAGGRDRSRLDAARTAIGGRPFSERARIVRIAVLTAGRCDSALPDGGGRFPVDRRPGRAVTTLRSRAQRNGSRMQAVRHA